MKNRRNLDGLTSTYAIVGMAMAGRTGRDWYQFAESQVRSAAASLGIDPQRFADIIAVTSPRVQVVRNVRMAVRYVRDGDRTGMMKTVAAALDHWHLTGEIRGPKTSEFAKAIMGDTDRVVLDVWMAKAFGIPQKWLDAKYVRAECARRVRDAALILGWTPAQVQAAVWTTAVRDAGREPGILDIASEV
jgi:hypothetical protein